MPLTTHPETRGGISENSFLIDLYQRNIFTDPGKWLKVNYGARSGWYKKNFRNLVIELKYYLLKWKDSSKEPSEKIHFEV